MIIRGNERLLVQGITGRQGSFWTERMQEYGTTVVGGVNPKKAGTECCGVPVFASAVDAAKNGCEFDVSVLFIPPLGTALRFSGLIPQGWLHPASVLSDLCQHSSKAFFNRAT